MIRRTIITLLTLVAIFGGFSTAAAFASADGRNSGAGRQLVGQPQKPSALCDKCKHEGKAGCDCDKHKKGGESCEKCKHEASGTCPCKKDQKKDQAPKTK